jgi:peptidoglycan-N-acetylglucosamine deacetylase
MRKPKLIKILIISVIIFSLFSLSFFAAYKISRSRSFQFFGGIVNRFETKEKVVALTFDDGPTNRVDEILSILASEDVKATFFLIGKDMEKYPEEAKKLASAGQQIGNHTYSHNRMVLKSPSYIKSELESTNELIRSAGYKGEIQFRPPNGKKLVFLPYYLKKNNMKTIMWDIEPESYSEVTKSPEKMIEYVVNNAKPGSIILLHPMYKSGDNTVASLKWIIQGLKAKGYSFKTVNELLK